MSEFLIMSTLSPEAEEELLLDLAERAEKYDMKPRDRALCQEIAIAVGWHPPGVDTRLMETDSRWLYLRRCPDYLWSLDAAKYLLSEGWAYLIGNNPPDDVAMVAEMWPLGKYDSVCVQGEHPTSDAAALTAAALRVRASLLNVSPSVEEEA